MTPAEPRAMQFDRDRIPPLLSGLDRWVTWRAGEPKPSGKFDKVPIDADTGRPVNATDPSNWLNFADACAAYDSGRCSGLGIALCDQPVAEVDGQSMYLVALDLDQCADRSDRIRQVKKEIGPTYVEISPSGNGLRMFALSKLSMKGGNAGGGRELYSTGRFMTVTGHLGRGKLLEATDGLQKLEREWFPSKLALRGKPPMLAHLISSLTPETRAYIDRVKAQLACISADCSYERWRDVVWSVLSTRWECAEGIARDWSASAPHRFDEQAFEQLCRNHAPSRGITLGTLHHHALKAGWQPAAAAPTPPRPEDDQEKPQRSRLLTGKDLQALPPMQWRIRGVLPARGLAAVYGPSGSGKTFLALDLACSISTGVASWFGAKVKPAPVAYVALEGEAGIRSRLAAWEKQIGRQVSDTARFVLGGFTLLRPDDAKELAAEVLARLGAGAVVVVDTLNQSAPGADENASTDMGRVIANAKTLADAIDGLVVLVHHAGKDASRGMRGHSSLFAAMDTVIEVSSSPSGRMWRLSKSKEGDSGVWCGFELVPHVVGCDEDGADIRSCAMRPALPGAAKAAKPVTGKHQKAALEVLGAMSASNPDGIPMLSAIPAVGAALLACPHGRRHARAVEVIKSLTESGHLRQEDEGVIFLP